MSSKMLCLMLMGLYASWDNMEVSDPLGRQSDIEREKQSNRIYEVSALTERALLENYHQGR